MSKKLKNTIGYSMIFFSIGLLIIQSHILTPIKTEKKSQKENVIWIHDEPIKIKKAKELDNKCYIGELDDKINNKEFYNGLLNYLCDTYGEKYIRVSTKDSDILSPNNQVLAKTSGALGMIFYANNLNEYGTSDFSMAHVVFHEYIHLLMFRRIANAYTLDKKSTELINGTAYNYSNIRQNDLFPTDYAYSSPKEQIAEILGIYLAKRVSDADVVLTSNFEQDLYKNLVNNFN